MLKVLQKGKQSHKPTQTPQSPLFPGPLNQCSILLFYCSLLGVNLHLCFWRNLLHAGNLFFFQKCKNQFCLELLPGSNFMCGCVKQPSAGWLLQGSHTWALPRLHHPLLPMGSSRVKVLEPGKNWVTISLVLCTTCMEHKSSSVEHGLLANGILHPIYWLLPSFKTTWFAKCTV